MGQLQKGSGAIETVLFNYIALRVVKTLVKFLPFRML